MLSSFLSSSSSIEDPTRSHWFVNERIALISDIDNIKFKGPEFLPHAIHAPGKQTAKIIWGLSKALSQVSK